MLMLSQWIIKHSALKKYLQINCLTMELRAKDIKRSTSKNHKDINLEDDDAKPKVNLSAFKIQKKQKLPKQVTNKDVTDKITPNTRVETKRRKSPKTFKTETDSSEEKLILPNIVKIEKDVTSFSRIGRDHVKIEYDEDDPSPSKRKCKVEKKEDIKTEKNDKMPYNWEIVLNNLREMRKSFNAPVDSMGCHKCHDDTAEPKAREFIL